MYAMSISALIAKIVKLLYYKFVNYAFAYAATDQRRQRVMGTIEELGVNLVRKTDTFGHKANNATIFLPDDFPFSVQSLDSTFSTIRNLFGDDAWGGTSARFNEETGMGLTFFLPQGKEGESLEVVRNADLPLRITQPDSDKPQLKLLAVHDQTVLIEPAQVITSEQIRDLIRTRPLEAQEAAKGHWQVELHKGYLKLHVQSGTFGFSRLDSFQGVLTPAYPYVTEHVNAYIDTDNGTRTGTMHLRIKLEEARDVTFAQDILDAAATTPGFSNIASKNRYITAKYCGAETLIIHPINQTKALQEIILDLMLKLGVFPAHATLHIGLPEELNGRPVVTNNAPFGTVAGRYPFPN